MCGTDRNYIRQNFEIIFILATHAPKEEKCRFTASTHDLIRHLDIQSEREAKKDES
jgi:hypothetical protein